MTNLQIVTVLILFNIVLFEINRQLYKKRKNGTRGKRF